MGSFLSVRKQRGMAMMLVLWVVTVLTIMAGAFALSTRRTVQQTQQSQLAAQSWALADGGVQYAMFMLTHPDPLQRWRSDGTPYMLRFPAGDLRIRVTDEGGKMDINAMQEATLRAFFTNALSDADLAARLADTILDWRDRDSLRRQSGAELDDYRAAGRSPAPQNRPFLMPEELAGVLGMTPELFARIEPLITVWSGQDGVDPMKASIALLRVLFRGDENQIAMIMAARDDLASGRGSPPNLVPPPGFTFASAASTAFRVAVEVWIGGEPQPGVEAVLRRADNAAGKPFSTASWRVLIPSTGVPPSPKDALAYR